MVKRIAAHDIVGLHELEVLRPRSRNGILTPKLTRLGEVMGYPCWIVRTKNNFDGRGCPKKRSTYVLLTTAEKSPRDGKSVVCLMRLARKSLGYHVSYVSIRRSKRGIGLGKAMYKFLAGIGMTIVSGDLQTLHSERLWLSLARGRKLAVRYYDASENRIGRARIRGGKLVTDTGKPIHGDRSIVMLLSGGKIRKKKKRVSLA